MLRKLFTNNIDNIKHIGYTTFVNAIRTNAINNIQELKEFGFNLREDINNAPFEDNAFQARLQPILLNVRINSQQDIELDLNFKLQLEDLYNEIILSVNEEVLYEKTTELSQNGSDVNINDLFEDLDSKFQMPSMVNKNVTVPSKGGLFGNKLTKSLTRSFSSTVEKIPKIYIGGDFKDLVTKSDVFVDKSLFIKEILEDPAEAILITMPRRWGKSLNLDMLKRFLSVQVDKDGKIIDLKITNNYKLFAGGEIDLDFDNTNYLKALKISTDDFCIKRQGQYPVIHIDFKDCKGSDVNEIKGTLQSELYKTVAKFSYLKNSEKEYEISTIKDAYLKLAEDIKLGNFKHSLKELSALLHAHHGKKVWILIDEYDAAANKAYLEFSTEEAKQVSGLFRGTFESAFKGNEHLEKGVMTGVQYIVKSGMLSGLNNLTRYNVTDTKYSQYYGINQQEMDYLLKAFNIDLESDKATGIQNWYNGYQEKDINTENDYINKYNIWSVVNYLNAYADSKYTPFKSYWEKSGSVSEFLNNIFVNKSFKQAIENLTNGYSISIGEPKTDFDINDFKNLKEIKDNINVINLTESGLNLIYSYLFITGYFTMNENGQLKFPNKEIQKEMSNYLKDFYNQIFNIPTENFIKVTNVLSEVFVAKDQNEIKILFKEKFAPQFEKLISLVDKDKVFGNEDMVHSLLNNIAIQVVNAKFATERYTTKPDDSRGRADIVLSKEDRGIVIEMKYHKDDPSEQGARERATDALAQAKTYIELVKDDTMKIFIGCNITNEQEVFLSGEIQVDGSESVTFEYP